MNTTEPEVIVFQTGYMKIFSDVQVVLVLSQIFYWHRPSKLGSSKLRIYKEGKWWVSKSHTEWTAETGLSRMQVRRALDVLTRAGVIETHVYRFDKTPTSHLRLVVANGKRLMLSNPLDVFPLVASNHPMVTGNHPMAPTSQTLTETTQQTTTESKEAAASPLDQTWIGVGLMNLKELLAHKKAEKLPPTETPVTHSSASLSWRKGFAEYTGGFAKNLTGKESGQLKLVLSSCREAGVPDEDIYRLFSYAPIRWSEVFSGLTKNGDKCSSNPELWVLVQYWPTILQLIATPHTKIAGCPPPSIAKAAHIPDTSPGVITIEEAEAFWASQSK